jgi:hypothetical protein
MAAPESCDVRQDGGDKVSKMADTKTSVQWRCCVINKTPASCSDSCSMHNETPSFNDGLFVTTPKQWGP